MAKLGKKYLDKSGLSYLWKRIDGRYVHINNDEVFEDGEIIVGINGENGVTGSGVTIGGATLSETPTAKVVATEAAVAAKVDEINSAIEELGAVMSFLGVTTTDVSTDPAKTTATVQIGGKEVKASNGDVVIFGTDKPTEYVWIEKDSVWQEIGTVFNDEAIKEVIGSDAISVATTDGTSTVSLTINDTDHPVDWATADSGYGHIHLSQDSTNGLKAEYGREVLTIGDAMEGTDIDEAITNASNISWVEGTGWTNGFNDFQ